MTTTLQLKHWMRHDATFAGMFPLNIIPHLPRSSKGHSFIVNTQTDNLPGELWIAVRIVHDQAWIFDSLSISPSPATLCHHLITHCFIRILHECEQRYQPLNTLTCGQHCIYFLYTSSPAPSETVVKSFVKKL